MSLVSGAICPGLNASRVKGFLALATRRHRRQSRNHSLFVGDKIGRFGDTSPKLATTVLA